MKLKSQFLGLFKQHQDQFKEIKDHYNRIHLYVNQTIIDGTYYCYQHLQYEDVKVEKRGGSHCPPVVPSLSPNNIDSRRICENQKCKDEQFVDEKSIN